LEENTGRRVDRQRLTRIRRIRDSESPPIPSSSAPRTRGREEDAEFEAGRDIGQIWEGDEEDRIGGEPPDEEDMDMDDFIDDDEQDEGMAEEEREERRRERKRLEKERYRALGARPELSGIDAGSVQTFERVNVSFQFLICIPQSLG
jgi:transcription elongation factor SPT6